MWMMIGMPACIYVDDTRPYLKLHYEQQVMGGMEGAQLEVHLVAATMAH